MPTPIPLGAVATGFANNSYTTNSVVTVNPIDVTPSGGMTAITNGLVAGAPVKVYGVPQADGTLRAYVLAYFELSAGLILRRGTP
jgi:hypothetical protein